MRYRLRRPDAAALSRRHGSLRVSVAFAGCLLVAGGSQLASSSQPPVIGVEPLALSSILFTGGEAFQDLTISNAGGSPLEFSLSVLVNPSDGGIPGVTTTCSPTTVLVNEYNSGELSSVDLISGTVIRI